MKKLNLFIAFICVTFLSCDRSDQDGDLQKWKNEVQETEKAFNDMAQTEGLIKAFEYYAADDGVIRRSKKIIKGKKAIKEWYQQDVRPNETLTWKPTFIDVSSSGDLAYTYGDFTFTSVDSLGNQKVNKGIFHTVWKRQSDGAWRFVWD